MTTRAELQRRIRAIKAQQEAALSLDPRAQAIERVRDGCPTDDDIELLLDVDVYVMVSTASVILDRDGLSRREQLERGAVFRLLVDVTDAAEGDEQQAALRALRELAQHGRYRDDHGWQRASPEQQGIARLYLRAVLRWLPYRKELMDSDQSMDAADLVRAPAKPAKPANF